MMSAFDDDVDSDHDHAFTEAADRLMEVIDAFREAGLSDDEILSEIKARLS